MASTSTDNRPRPGESPRGSVRQLALFSVACLALFGYLATALFYTLPTNALSSRHSKGARTVLNTVTPENWAFFTRNPQNGQIGVYASGRDGAVRNLLVTPQGDPSNLFGISRTQRAQGPELGYLNAAAASRWVPCAGFLEPCIKEATARPAQQVTNSSPVPTVCGDAFLTQEKTVPWSFRNQVPYTRRVVQIAHLDVRCK
ncbi:SdpA family antimicrobial peptide system protein [Streptomyces luteireticuli]|uniref:SdpA family antimicrobial peptide system protein n=1 Tax=Streptomyces luteireticuli TaxID=173858 RepID=A0ABN0YB36_9ACTN